MEKYYKRGLGSFGPPIYVNSTTFNQLIEITDDDGVGWDVGRDVVNISRIQQNSKASL